MKAALLTIELVPKSCWFSNVRSQVDTATWDKLRRSTYKSANHVCQVCGGRGPKWPVECHEIFHYDDELHIQKLTGLIALCPDCHSVKHIGYAAIQNKADQAEAHLARINGWSEQETSLYLEKVWRIWRLRSREKWELNLDWLELEDGQYLERNNK